MVSKKKVHRKQAQPFISCMVNRMSLIPRLELTELPHEMSTDQPRINSSIDNDTERETRLYEAERNFKIIFYCCLFVFGSIGNFLVVVVVKEKRKRTINDYFILNLAIADLTFLWFSVPFYSYELFQPFTKNVFYCKVIWPMMSVTLSASIFTLTSMAVERCRGITNPLRPRIKLKATIVWIFLVWICAFVTILPLMIVARQEKDACVEDWPNNYFRQSYTAALFGMHYVIPLLIITITYLRIAFFLLRSRLPMRTSINSSGQLVRLKTRTENVHIIQTLAVIVILFMACMLPNQIAWMLFDFGGDSYNQLSHAFWTCAEALIYFHACVNPIVYGTLTRQFRRVYIRVFLNIFCCSKKSFMLMGTSENLSSERKSRREDGAFVLHGSLRYRGVIERRETSHLEIRSSPNLSTSAESNCMGSRSATSSSARHSISKEVRLRTSGTQDCMDTKKSLNMSFSNNALDESSVEDAEDERVQETKL